MMIATTDYKLTENILRALKAACDNNLDQVNLSSSAARKMIAKLIVKEIKKDELNLYTH